MYKPKVPYSAFILLYAPIIEFGYIPVAGFESCIFSFMASHGQRRQSAIISAKPDAAIHPIFRYLGTFYSLTIL